MQNVFKMPINQKQIYMDDSNLNSDDIKMFIVPKKTKEEL